MKKQALIVEITQKELFVLAKEFSIDLLEGDIPCIRKRLLPNFISQSVDRSGSLLFVAEKCVFGFDNIKQIINVKFIIPPLIVIGLIAGRISDIHHTSRLFNEVRALKSINVFNPGLITENNEKIIIRLNLEFS